MGPTVAIWLSPQLNPPTTHDLLSIAHKLDARAHSEKHFYVTSSVGIGGQARAEEPRPFGLALGFAGLDRSEVQAAEAVLGFEPAHAVHAFAYANASIDHRILGELAVFLAHHFGGVIDFGGLLGPVTSPVGRLLTIPYSGSTLGECFNIADAEFLQWWLQQDDFHMVK